MEVLDAIHSQPDSTLKEKFEAALSCVQRTFDLFGVSGVAFSFNGGKDSTVLLHILRAAAAQRLQSQRLHSNGFDSQHGDLGGVCTFIFERKDDFPEILEFVRATNQRHGLQVEELEGDFQAGLSALLARKPIKAVVIGTRRGDPNAGGQDICCLSSAGWPAFMRINPILEWSFSDVWSFLRATRVHYCGLYDQGYTSIGSINNTLPNGALQKEDGSHAPAYMLADNRLERAGRVSSGTPRASEARGLTRSAAIIVIGDEILSGKVSDENAEFLIHELFSIGWRVCKIVTIPDEVAVIAKEVHSASEAYDIVITSGGVGPTLDDVTMAGVAQGLGYSLTHNQSLERRLREYFGEHITDSHLKMAEAPAEEVELVEYARADGKLSPFPVVCCRNIFILPGVPHLLHQKWKAVKERLKQDEELPKFHSIALRLSLQDETAIAPTLCSIATDTRVAVKSYPLNEQSDGAGIVLSLEGKDEANLEEAKERIVRLLPAGCILGVEHDPKRLSKQRLST